LIAPKTHINGGRKFLRGATLKTLLLAGAAYNTYITSIIALKTFNKILLH